MNPVRPMLNLYIRYIIWGNENILYRITLMKGGLTG